MTISINEAIVGLTSIGGSFVGGLVADWYKLDVCYLLAGGMVFVAIAIQAQLHRRFGAGGGGVTFRAA